MRAELKSFKNLVYKHKQITVSKEETIREVLASLAEEIPTLKKDAKTRKLNIYNIVSLHIKTTLALLLNQSDSDKEKIIAHRTKQLITVLQTIFADLYPELEKISEEILNFWQVLRESIEYSCSYNYPEEVMKNWIVKYQAAINALSYKDASMKKYANYQETWNLLEKLLKQIPELSIEASKNQKAVLNELTTRIESQYKKQTSPKIPLYACVALAVLTMIAFATGSFLLTLALSTATAVSINLNQIKNLKRSIENAYIKDAIESEYHTKEIRVSDIDKLLKSTREEIITNRLKHLLSMLERENDLEPIDVKLSDKKTITVLVRPSHKEQIREESAAAGVSGSYAYLRKEHKLTPTQIAELKTIDQAPSQASQIIAPPALQNWTPPFYRVHAEERNFILYYAPEKVFKKKHFNKIPLIIEKFANLVDEGIAIRGPDGKSGLKIIQNKNKQNDIKGIKGRVKICTPNNREYDIDILYQWEMKLMVEENRILCYVLPLPTTLPIIIAGVHIPKHNLDWSTKETYSSIKLDLADFKDLLPKPENETENNNNATADVDEEEYLENLLLSKGWHPINVPEEEFSSPIKGFN